MGCSICIPANVDKKKPANATTSINNDKAKFNSEGNQPFVEELDINVNSNGYLLPVDVIATIINFHSFGPQCGDEFFFAAGVIGLALVSSTWMEGIVLAGDFWKHHLRHIAKTRERKALGNEMKLRKWHRNSARRKYKQLLEDEGLWSAEKDDFRTALDGSISLRFNMDTIFQHEVFFFHLVKEYLLKTNQYCKIVISSHYTHHLGFAKQLAFFRIVGPHIKVLSLEDCFFSDELFEQIMERYFFKLKMVRSKKKKKKEIDTNERDVTSSMMEKASEQGLVALEIGRGCQLIHFKTILKCVSRGECTQIATSEGCDNDEETSPFFYSTLQHLKINSWHKEWDKNQGVLFRSTSLETYLWCNYNLRVVDFSDNDCNPTAFFIKHLRKGIGAAVEKSLASSSSGLPEPIQLDSLDLSFYGCTTSFSTRKETYATLNELISGSNTNNAVQRFKSEDENDLLSDDSMSVSERIFYFEKQLALLFSTCYPAGQHFSHHLRHLSLAHLFPIGFYSPEVEIDYGPTIGALLVNIFSNLKALEFFNFSGNSWFSDEDGRTSRALGRRYPSDDDYTGAAVWNTGIQQAAVGCGTSSCLLPGLRVLVVEDCFFSEEQIAVLLRTRKENNNNGQAGKVRVIGGIGND